MADLIRMEHITKYYGRVHALDDVNFAVREQRDRRACSATTAPASRR